LSCRHPGRDDLEVRVHRNFAFLDLSGFTALTALEGDERAVSLLSGFRTKLRGICSRRGVRIAKWLGDGAMLVGVDARPLVESTLEVQCGVGGNVAEVRCGISSGDVLLMEGDDYVGHSVNVAARLCDIALGGEVLATTSILDALPKWGAVLATHDRVVRGLERPLPVVCLGLRPIEGSVLPDPVCGIPLSAETAVEIVPQPFGEPVWLCSDSCRDTWQRRPQPAQEDHGSPRVPLIGS
jgi:adenylate cyclase